LFLNASNGFARSGGYFTSSYRLYSTWFYTYFIFCISSDYALVPLLTSSIWNPYLCVFALFWMYFYHFKTLFCWGTTPRDPVLENLSMPYGELSRGSRRRKEIVCWFAIGASWSISGASCGHLGLGAFRSRDGVTLQVCWRPKRLEGTLRAILGAFAILGPF